MTNLRTVLANVNGASFVGLDTVTNVTLTGGKKNPMQGRVTKRMVGAQVMVFQNKKSNAYENMVQRRLAAEGLPTTFEVGPRAWGTRLENLPVVEHVKDGVTKHYLEVIFLRAGTTEYLLDGVVTPKESIQGLKENSASDGEGQGGLSNKVIIRTFALDSLTAVRIDRTEYTGPFTFS